VKKILNQPPGARSLYRPAFEKDNCGFGLIAQMDDLCGKHSTAVLNPATIRRCAPYFHFFLIFREVLWNMLQTLTDLREYVKNLDKFCARQQFLENANTQHYIWIIHREQW